MQLMNSESMDWRKLQLPSVAALKLAIERNQQRETENGNSTKD